MTQLRVRLAPSMNSTLLQHLASSPTGGRENASAVHSPTRSLSQVSEVRPSSRTSEVLPTHTHHILSCYTIYFPVDHYYSYMIYIILCKTINFESDNYFSCKTKLRSNVSTSAMQAAARRAFVASWDNVHLDGGGQPIQTDRVKFGHAEGRLTNSHTIICNRKKHPPVRQFILLKWIVIHPVSTFWKQYFPVAQSLTS